VPICAIDGGMVGLYKQRDKQRFKYIRLVEWDFKDLWEWCWTEEELEMRKRWIREAAAEGVESLFDYGDPVQVPAKLETNVYQPARSDYAALVAEGSRSFSDPQSGQL
jgi:hypothetical protein